ncbi:HMR1 protein, partial [Alcedo cyanopectus]|nr:HMR1 protein [Ceyx cyanopectus]
SLRYLHIAVSEPGPGLPQFMAMGYVDGIPITRYDSDTRRVQPRAEWMAANLDQQYWDTQTEIIRGHQEVYRVNLDTL